MSHKALSDPHRVPLKLFWHSNTTLDEAEILHPTTEYRGLYFKS